ncbi:conserved membrane hypothetical protein [Bosea sp. 62]|uniref:hypothetical protein n=1 Tax=unclassified Bosea (in: a-proteobacteria) TaxID=2653178 RepID=UPI001258BA3F|nr:MULTISPECIES: hypothetical protein [unclassified Bosea (in: a-proteobacteria)]CAD5253809.1 conserved membrane hypothetical protein [Bosea sp. 21B]CAD5287035.1 conserved membrane hypothetical protein [Bosea sp. 7B]CAD5301215.1 conserved membrane hypothetical protein [Bosea sp. 46]VVT57338.1 conserved membrane hypothetical protein [Bosea sp. EC-HK365B]VXB66147.1 conserved membrane hypothetical protein [Bosea sp. 125]
MKPPATLLAFLAIEILLFAGASLIHAGILVGGYEHSQASAAEGVIGAVLALSLVLCLLRQAIMRTTALAVQAFALLGTLVGVFTIMVGVGPQMAADKAFHGLLLVVLVAGLVAAWRAARR